MPMVKPSMVSALSLPAALAFVHRALPICVAALVAVRVWLSLAAHCALVSFIAS
jgi:hypothetical protein